MKKKLAFPTPYPGQKEPGLTIREYFIGQALAGTAHALPHEPGPEGMAKRAIAIADAVLKLLSESRE